MDPLELKKWKVSSRPYPQDSERRILVKQKMLANGFETIAQLSKAVQINYTVLADVINGTRRSVSTEQRIANFFNVPVESLFPKRTPEDLARMNKEQNALGGAA